MDDQLKAALSGIRQLRIEDEKAALDVVTVSAQTSLSLRVAKVLALPITVSSAILA